MLQPGSGCFGRDSTDTAQTPLGERFYGTGGIRDSQGSVPNCPHL